MSEALEDHGDEGEKAPLPEWNEIDWDAEKAEASKQGWKPLSDWVAAGNDPNDHVDPRVYNARGRVINRNKALDREVAEMRQELKNLATQSTEQMRQQAKRLRAELEKSRDEAIDAGDKDRVREVDQQLKSIQEPSEPVREDPTPKVQEWLTRHANDLLAYPDRMEILRQVDASRQSFGLSNTGDVEADMDAALAKAREIRPDVFGTPKPRASLDGGQPTSRKKSVGVKFKDLPAGEQAGIERMAELAGMSIDDYMKRYNGEDA